MRSALSRKALGGVNSRWKGLRLGGLGEVLWETEMMNLPSLTRRGSVRGTSTGAALPSLVSLF
jgi:hypothetical protein